MTTHEATASPEKFKDTGRLKASSKRSVSKSKTPGRVYHVGIVTPAGRIKGYWGGPLTLEEAEAAKLGSVTLSVIGPEVDLSGVKAIHIPLRAIGNYLNVRRDNQASRWPIKERFKNPTLKNGKFTIWVVIERGEVVLIGGEQDAGWLTDRDSVGGPRPQKVYRVEVTLPAKQTKPRPTAIQGDRTH